MKKMLFSLQNTLWSAEIIVCIAALVIGLIICAARPYTAPVQEIDVETYVPVVENGIDGVNSAAEEEGVYNSEGIIVQLP